MLRLSAHRPLALSIAAGILAMASIAGCNKGPAVGTINGEVTLDGKPIQDGRILFSPIDGQGGTGGGPIVEGKFTAPDVPANKMKVEINGNKVIGKIKAYDTPESPLMDNVVEIVPHRYNVNSELTLEVKPGIQDVKYELKSK